MCFAPLSGLLAWVERDLTFHLWDVANSLERPAPLNKLSGSILSISSYRSPFGPKPPGDWLLLRTIASTTRITSAAIWDGWTQRPENFAGCIRPKKSLC